MICLDCLPRLLCPARAGFMDLWHLRPHWAPYPIPEIFASLNFFNKRSIFLFYTGPWKLHRLPLCSAHLPMLPHTRRLRACCSLCVKCFYTPNPHHWHCLLLSSLLLLPWISTKLSLPPGSPPCPPQLGQVPFYRLVEHHALSSITLSMVAILHLLYVLHAKSLQWYPTLWDPMVYSLSGSPVHGILQARILEGVAMPSSRASSWPRDQTHVSYFSCIVR